MFAFAFQSSTIFFTCIKMFLMTKNITTSAIKNTQTLQQANNEVDNKSGTITYHNENITTLLPTLWS